MTTVYSVPEFYSLTDALAAASPGDIIYLTENHYDKFTLTKAVHLMGPSPGAGQRPTTTIDWGGYYDGIITLNISPENWGDVTDLYIENLVLHTSYDSSSDKGFFKISQDIPTGRRLVANKCVFNEVNADDSQVFYARSQPERQIFASFYHCWFSYRYEASGDNGPDIPADEARFVTTNSQLTFEWCVGKHHINTACVDKLGANFLYTNYVVSTNDIGTLYGPWNGVDRFGSGFDGPNYALYGEITDIPPHIDTTDFVVALYVENGSYTNKMSHVPISIKGFGEVVQTSFDPDPVLYKGTWRFDYLPLNQRYGVLIHPPDGMQGHWLRWYQPEALILP